MYRNSFIKLCIYFCFTMTVWGQEVAFQNGEFLKFKVRYGFFNTSYAQLLLKETEMDGKRLFHAVGKGETVGLARLFFKVDDTYESFFFVQKVQPLMFIRNIYEGGYTKNIRATFNSDKQMASIYNVETKKTSSVSVPEHIQDAVSAFYFLREQTDTSQIKVGDEISIQTLFDDDEIFTFKLKLIGKEPLQTLFGEVNTLIFQPIVQDGRVFKSKESVTIWISDDQNKIPLKVRAELRVGALTAELIDFNRLKHPTALKQ